MSRRGWTAKCKNNYRAEAQRRKGLQMEEKLLLNKQFPLRLGA
jgi:hypothetical protein